MDGQNHDDRPLPGHDQLSHDEPVSLREPQVMSTESPMLPSKPVAAAEAQFPAFVPVAATMPAAAVAAPVSPYALPPDETYANTDFQPPVLPNLSWTASEFIAHPKTVKWYAVLAAATIVLLVLAWLFAHDIVTEVVITLAAIMLGVTAARQPRELSYAIDEHSITVGDKAYPLKDFRSFSVVDEGHFSSVNFLPVKRFAPMLTVYYDPQHETHLLDLLTQQLPMAEHHYTAIDGLMKRIRF